MQPRQINRRVTFSLISPTARAAQAASPTAWLRDPYRDHGIHGTTGRDKRNNRYFGSRPVAIGRDGSALHADHDPT